MIHFARSGQHPASERTTISAGLVVTACLALVAGLFSGCTRFVLPASQGVSASYLAYWEETTGPTCPTGEVCTASRDNRSDFIRLVDQQRQRGLEIDKFDAFVTSGHEIYVGAWRGGVSHRTFRFDLRWKHFHALHKKMSALGRHLVHLSVYPHDGDTRVAAIWAPSQGGEVPTQPERMSHDHDWESFIDLDQRMRDDGYYLVEFEVYPRPSNPERPWVAGVWRLGEEDSVLQRNLTCQNPCPRYVPAPVGTPRIFAQCEFTATLGVMREKGLYPSDIESYEEDGEVRFAVLFHRRRGTDWLLIRAGEKEVQGRQRTLNEPVTSTGPVISDFGFGLIDLDLYSFQVIGGTPNHLGIVHDAGTAGPGG